METKEQFDLQPLLRMFNHFGGTIISFLFLWSSFKDKF